MNFWDKGHAYKIYILFYIIKSIWKQLKAWYNVFKICYIVILIEKKIQNKSLRHESVCSWRKAEQYT